MWIIALVMFHGLDYQVASNQILYSTLASCEQGKQELVARLEATKPKEGKLIARCVQMSEGTNA